ncbi:similar to Saccharomyces cerevisiae YDR511W ACN9 Protein of the mitochondrial intermembrane space, required for acetate utilization and gluconeogenesis [Geotrichum candidum]|uniref:Succinate dehydrogenase assembly factor 3 n=1 Tax=Geotrichum candidum TaxID=1173061 RepID=A0A0J9X9Z1_GEOCN|nr:similar to Saccharomyces cerevisiae YDR511W ACN9 Protein of the mitochondrial intermembrane space, required for acetate utilization and gluconeogenesis [Geotrichum candidum]
MRFTAVLRATRRKPKPVIPILPPIPLYRRVLRANRKLDPDVRVLGDEYVKSEFRAHRTTDNPLYIVGFLTQWQNYAEQIEGDTWKTQKLDMEKLSKMSDEQVIQLYELMQAAHEQPSEYGDVLEDAPKKK